MSREFSSDEIEPPLEEILRFQKPIVIVRSNEEIFPLLLKEPGDHTDEANYLVGQLRNLYMSRMKVEERIKTLNPKESRTGLEKLLKQDPDYNQVEGNIATLQGHSDPNYAIEIVSDEEGSIQKWVPYVFSSMYDVQWWSIITKSPDLTKEFERLQMDNPQGLQMCKQYLHARIDDQDSRTRKEERVFDQKGPYQYLWINMISF